MLALHDENLLYDGIDGALRAREKLGDACERLARSSFDEEFRMPSAKAVKAMKEALAEARAELKAAEKELPPMRNLLDEISATQSDSELSRPSVAESALVELQRSLEMGRVNFGKPNDGTQGWLRMHYVGDFLRQRGISQKALRRERALARMRVRGDAETLLEDEDELARVLAEIRGLVGRFIRCLFRNVGHEVDYQTLNEDVWGGGKHKKENAIQQMKRQAVKELRRRGLSHLADRIENIRGVGYRVLDG